MIKLIQPRFFQSQNGVNFFIFFCGIFNRIGLVFPKWKRCKLFIFFCGIFNRIGLVFPKWKRCKLIKVLPTGLVSFFQSENGVNLVYKRATSAGMASFFQSENGVNLWPRTTKKQRIDL